MTIAFVHGVPETAAIWDQIRAEFDEPTVALSAPGFGAPLPDDFDISSDGYLNWLIGEVEALDGPVDIIGHDWGGIHVIRLAMERPDLIRCWVSDIIGVFDPEYKWHDLAQAWQTPKVGEQTVGAMAMAPAKMKAAQLIGAGMTEAAAMGVAEGMNETMAKAILPLYRKAAQPFVAELGKDIAKCAAKPGLALIATEDAYTGGADKAHRIADKVGVEKAVMEGHKHWWMCQAPAEGAEIIKGFLAKHR